MPSPDAKRPSEDELIDRIAYLVRRTNSVEQAEARERARKILQDLSPNPSASKVAKSLRARRGKKSRSLDTTTENWFLSGIARLSSRDAEVLDILLSDGTRRPA